MKVAIQGTHRRRDLEVDRKNLKHAWDNAAILAANEAKEELSQSLRLFRHDCHDVCHSAPFLPVELLVRHYVYLNAKLRLAEMAGMCQY
jgi:hypothetical protein